jgi:hypothetical protein
VLRKQPHRRRGVRLDCPSITGRSAGGRVRGFTWPTRARRPPGRARCDPVVPQRALVLFRLGPVRRPGETVGQHRLIVASSMTAPLGPSTYCVSANGGDRNKQPQGRQDARALSPSRDRGLLGVVRWDPRDGSQFWGWHPRGPDPCAQAPGRAAMVKPSRPAQP